jgi:CRP/FNR family transcriptional regulator, cyclic AMP receptor protein
MTSQRFHKGQTLFREGDATDCVLRLASGEVEILRDLGGGAIVLGTLSAGQFIGEMGVVENRPTRSATARAATEVEVEVISPTDFLDRISRSPEAARELIRRLSQRLHEAEDRIVTDERSSGGRAAVRRKASGAGTSVAPAALHGAQLALAAKHPALRRQLEAPIAPSTLPFVVGRRPFLDESSPARSPDLTLDDQVPFRLSRAHFMIAERGGRYYVRDLGSTLGTIVNGEPIGHHFGADDAPLRTGENEVIAGGVGSPFAFAVTVS